MDIAVTIVMMIPVILAVALIVNVVRKNITERQPGDPVDITGAIPAVIVLMVAVLIIGSMGASIAPYSWDEDSGELTINKDVGSGAQDWDSYGTSVKSLVINSNVTTVADGAFDTLTALEYISISESVESITSSAFGVDLNDYLDQTVSEVVPGEYYGLGDGTLYLYDPEIFTYSSAGTTITGLTTEATAAKVLVLPGERNGTTVTSIQGLDNNTNITTVLSSKDCEISILIAGVFLNDTALETVVLPDSVTELRTNCFNGTTSLTSIDLPDSVKLIGLRAFQRSGLTSIAFPASVESILGGAFYGVDTITSVSFDEGFSPTLDSAWADSWTFYDSDGTTTLDKTVASNLAGYTFQGTASALVKVLPDRAVLTTEQTLKVQELTKAASKTLLLDETEISSVEEKELASA